MGLAENLGPVALWWAWLSPSLGELFGSGFGVFLALLGSHWASWWRMKETKILPAVQPTSHWLAF